MHRFFKLLTLSLLLSACNQSSPVSDSEDSASVARGIKQRESLFDTTPPALRNTDHYHSVEIRQMRFEPGEIWVHKGDTIRWINNDIVTHDVTEEKNKDWSSSALPVGSSWETVVVKSADYFCSIHIMMKGKIIVE